MLKMIDRINRININRMTVEGFKGYNHEKTFELGNTTKIYADNGQGKTSIGEAITWAFLGSNLWGNDKSDSDLKNKTSKKMKVEVEFTDGEKDYILSRSRYGNKTTITLNNKEIRQVDLYYLLGNKDIFLSIFNPMYYFTMSQKQAREFIVSILPEIKIEDVIENLEGFELEYIKDDLTYIHNNPNEYMKKKRKGIKELEEDIIYIEGILSTLKEPADIEKYLDMVGLRDTEKKYQDKKKLLEELILEKHNLEKEKVKIENQKIKTLDTTELYKKKMELEKGLELIKAKEYETNKDILKKLVTLESEVDNLRKEYTEKNNLTLKEGDNCPVCKTVISKHHLAVLEGEIEDTLKEITEKGKKKTQEINEIIEKEKKLKEKFNVLKENRIRDFKTKLSTINKEIEGIEKKNLEEIKNDKLKEYDIEISLLDKKIETFKKEFKEIEEGYYKLKSEIEVRKKQIEENKEKTIEYQQKIKEHNKTIETYQKQISIAQNYTSLKVKLLSEIIHKNLDKVEIELQKIVKSTGEIKDTFEVKYMGKKHTIISASEKIKAGLEITDMIINLTGLYYPIFVDNGESITEYSINNDVQIIETRVVKGKKLEVIIEDDIKMAI